MTESRVGCEAATPQVASYLGGFKTHPTLTVKTMVPLPRVGRVGLGGIKRLPSIARSFPGPHLHGDYRGHHAMLIAWQTPKTPVENTDTGIDQYLKKFPTGAVCLENTDIWRTQKDSNPRPAD